MLHVIYWLKKKQAMEDCGLCTLIMPSPHCLPASAYYLGFFDLKCLPF